MRLKGKSLLLSTILVLTLIAGATGLLNNRGNHEQTQEVLVTEVTPGPWSIIITNNG